MGTRPLPHRLTARLMQGAGTALAAALLAGCAGQGMVVKANSADAARASLARGDGTKAVAGAEAAVAASPRDASLRVLLGQAYFKAGRFTSAATTFDDAMKLGDNTNRTALSLALAKIGAGDQKGALAVLDDWRDEIPASDLGLALALAGEPESGVIVLADAIRSGDDTPKTRQNLAYAYALAGRWREARLMAAQDVPAEKVGDRMSEWAATIQPEQYQARVAALLGAPLRSDPGQPAMLALANNPSDEQMLAEKSAADAPAVAAAAPAPAAKPAPTGGELPASDGTAVAVAVPAPTPAPAEPAPAVPVTTLAKADTAAAAVGFVSNPLVEALPFAPVKMPASVAVAKARPKPTRAEGTHMVQLGSFSSPQGARRAWGIYSARNASLAGYRMVITPANVNGKNVWRVAAAGFNGVNAANGLCSQVKARGGACFAYASTRRPAAPGNQRDAAGPEFARRR